MHNSQLMNASICLNLEANLLIYVPGMHALPVVNLINVSYANFQFHLFPSPPSNDSLYGCLLFPLNK